ncbi:MAG: class II aldolase/adducin family protein [Tabrizicola sp.]
MTADTPALRQAMIDTCRAMETKGLNQGTAGNLSVRVEEGFLVTPSSLSYDVMQPDDIVAMGWDGTYVGRRPSSEWRFHRDILKARPDVNVVLHCHSLYATSVACHHRTIPAFHYMVGVMGGTTLRCARYATFGTQALSDAAIEALVDRKACLLGQHGQISLGTSLEAALWMAVEVETLARMYIQACALGEPPVLSDEEMERVIAQMTRMSYGLGPEAEGSNDVARPRATAS